jgi:hypothetical protein
MGCVELPFHTSLPEELRQGEKMSHTLDHAQYEVNKIQDEEHRLKIMKQSAKIYLSIAIGAAILFFLGAYLAGGYPPVAKIGGMFWVGLLSLIIAMPIVTARVKKKLKQ